MIVSFGEKFLMRYGGIENFWITKFFEFVLQLIFIFDLKILDLFLYFDFNIFETIYY